MVWVVYDMGNAFKQTYAIIIDIVPLKQVEYRLISRYHGGELEGAKPVLLETLQELEKGTIVPIKLYAWNRLFISRSLREQGLKPQDYIEAVTVHGEWKAKMHQGICFIKGYHSIGIGTHIVTRSNEALDMVPLVLRKMSETEVERLGTGM
jgi:hypothetical protein